MRNMKRPYEPRGERVPYLRKWRERALLSQRELGERAASDGGLAIHRVTITRLESGSIASWSTIERLAKALGIDARWLVENTPPPQPRMGWNDTKPVH